MAAAAVEDLVEGLGKMKEVCVTSTFHLPPKLGGVLFGIYSRDNGKKYLEVTIIGKITKVLIRYLGSDGKLHSVNLHNPALSSGWTQSLILRVGGLRQSHISFELYINCRLIDSAHGLPSLARLPSKVEPMEVRSGQRNFARMQGSVESLKLALGGSLPKAGLLTDCSLQGDSTLHNIVGSDISAMLGDHTKALIGQLIIFNQIMGNLREDIRDMIRSQMIFTSITNR